MGKEFILGVESGIILNKNKLLSHKFNVAHKIEKFMLNNNNKLKFNPNIKLVKSIQPKLVEKEKKLFLLKQTKVELLLQLIKQNINLKLMIFCRQIFINKYPQIRQIYFKCRLKILYQIAC